MSAAEVKKFVKAAPLKNTTDHHANKNKTDSIGFCFMPVDDQEDDGVLYAARRLCGITTTEFCLVGELKHDNWRKGYGVYGDYDNLDADGYAPPKEYVEVSTKRYSRNDFTHWRVYGQNEMEEMRLAEMPPLVAMFMRNSSLAWKEPVFKHCSCYTKECSQ
jgi:hypothetical protein